MDVTTRGRAVTALAVRARLLW
uniref:Uncharacterized protein n=1 Tax=Anguilla anguilla TaxID=7936 RepID=A0A0E9Q451_ANGAN